MANFSAGQHCIVQGETMDDIDQSFIVSGKWVFQSPDQVSKNASVVVDQGYITDVGPTVQIQKRYAGLEEFGGPEFMVLPGFINAHHHCYGVELTNQAVIDDFLEPWMFAGFGMQPISQRLSTSYSAIRLLKSGVTSVVDMCNTGPNRTMSEISLHEKAEAYKVSAFVQLLHLVSDGKTD